MNFATIILASSDKNVFLLVVLLRIALEMRLTKR